MFDNPKEKENSGYEESRTRNTVTSTTEMVILRPDKLSEFVTLKVSELVSRGAFLSDTARQKFSSSLRATLITELASSTFHRFDISDEAGATRTKEMFLFRHTKMDDGNISILFSYFGCSTQLERTWKYLVANHDEAKLRKWLTYKLFENIMSKLRSIVSRPTSQYVRSLTR